MPRTKKRTKKRVKREPKPPTYLVFKCFNQTQEEVYFGVSMTCPKWKGSRHDLRNIPELAHWNLEFDKIMITKIYQRKRFATLELAYNESRYWERRYVHWRNFWVVQTGKNLLLTPRVRKPVKPPRLPHGYSFNPDLFDEQEYFEAELLDDIDKDDDEVVDGVDVGVVEE
jgi:hypothetical protein